MAFRVMLVFAAVAALPALATAQSSSTDVAAELQRVRGLRDEQRYREALPAVEALQARNDLSARQRLDVLRELSILRLILRDEAGARAALSTALARDPAFDLGSGDLPPRFSRALEEARASHPEMAVALRPPVVRVDRGALSIEVTVERGADAVDEIAAFVRDGGGGGFQELSLEGRPTARSERLVAPGELAYYVEARAPSGAVLARTGTADQAALLQVPSPRPDPAPGRPPGGVEVVPRPAPPAGGRRAERRSEGGGGVPAWVWIAGGVVVAAGAATAGVLIASPSEAREGTWGRAELGQ